MARLRIPLSAAAIVAWTAAGAATPSARAPAATPTISCPGDVVVWVNPRSKAYHLQGDSLFGRTKRGKFECRKAADTEGDHAIPTRK